MTETVYVLTNEAMPGLVKIGRTSADLQKRISDLSVSTGVPLRFECFYAVEVKNGKNVEAALHKIFHKERINPKREFFRVEPERVALSLSVGEYPEVVLPNKKLAPTEVAEDIAILEKFKKRKSKTSLSQLGIPVGSELTFSRDTDIKAVVIEGDQIQFEDRPTSLSAAALVALKRLHYKSTTANGAAYWMFEGELLTERRLRLEEARE